MNILFDPLPMAVDIDGDEVPIRTDFRDCLRVVLAFEDGSLAAAEQQIILLENLYPEPPANVQRAVEQGIKFLNGGEETPAEVDHAPRLYSFRQDARYIFAAFRQTHGIDLQTVEFLHWWAFLALFMDLGSETTFCSMVGLRQRVKSGKASPDERRLYQEMRDQLELDEEEEATPEEEARELEFLRRVAQGQAERQQKEQDR